MKIQASSTVRLEPMVKRPSKKKRTSFEQVVLELIKAKEEDENPGEWESWNFGGLASW